MYNVLNVLHCAPLSKARHNVTAGSESQQTGGGGGQEKGLTLTDV